MIINGMTCIVSRSLADNSLFKEVKSPMSGKMVGVFTKAGRDVKKGQVLVVLEAMKMENQIKSHVNGTVKMGEVLVIFE